MTFHLQSEPTFTLYKADQTQCRQGVKHVLICSIKHKQLVFPFFNSVDGPGTPGIYPDGPGYQL